MMGFDLACPIVSSKFTFQITEDGSPTLEIMRADGKAEKMHHFMGAFSETVHVYGRALELALQAGLPAHVFSLGLGLGYNEIMSVAAAVKYKVTPLIWSFESESNLREQFRAWILENAAQHDFQRSYDQVLKKMCEHFLVREDEVRAQLKVCLQAEQIMLLEDFHAEYDFKNQKFSVIFYDAFSDKINPELWDTTSLEHTLKDGTYKDCVFATYASKGRLKRALKEHHFELLDIAGYGGKRECTVATRLK
jgi:hypothetical protein